MKMITQETSKRHRVKLYTEIAGQQLEDCKIGHVTICADQDDSKFCF